MNTLFLISVVCLVVGAVFGGFLVWVYMRRHISESEKEIKRIKQEKEELEEAVGEVGASGLEEYNTRRQKEINERKDKIIQEIKEKGSIKTGDAQEMFDVSRSAAYRYLSELEEEGKIKQTEKFGREVRYALVE